jgi:hypothetical protein
VATLDGLPDDTHHGLMDSPAISPLPQVTCPRCGVRFGCQPDGNCWCATEPVRLPLPDKAAAAACLCPDCLRVAADTATRL